MTTVLSCGIELAKYAIELCKCNPGFDLAGLKDLAEKTIECAKPEDDMEDQCGIALTGRQSESKGQPAMPGGGMTKEEFEKGYAKRSGVTVEWLHFKNQFAIPCDCGESGCYGWQMANCPMRNASEGPTPTNENVTDLVKQMANSDSFPVVSSIVHAFLLTCPKILESDANKKSRYVTGD